MVRKSIFSGVSSSYIRRNPGVSPPSNRWNTFGIGFVGSKGGIGFGFSAFAAAGAGAAAGGAAAAGTSSDIIY